MTIINGIDSNQTLKTTDNVVFNTITPTAGYKKSVIAGVTTLTSNDFGTLVVCNGSTAYTITLPASTNGTYIDFFVNTGSYALITLAPPSGSIQGQSTFILGNAESCRVYGDGTNYWVQNYYMQPLSFSVNIAGGGQSIAGNTNVKVQFTVKRYDIGGFFDNVTNYRYQPLYPGKFQFTSMESFGSFGSDTYTESDIYFNGSSVSLVQMETQSPTASSTTNTNNIILSMNGSTDYVEFYIRTNNGSTKTLLGTTNKTYAMGSRISNF